jgi:uncharacterized lipoprotein YmbA
MKKIQKFIVIIISMSFLLWGCGRSPNSTFYTLSPLPNTPLEKGSYVVGVGPVSIADYLNQPSLVVRVNEQQLRLDEFHRWAGPLRDNVKDVLIMNLQVLLHSQSIISYPSRDMRRVPLQLIVRIEEFDTDLQGVSRLRASWQLYRRPSQKLLFANSKVFYEKVEGTLTPGHGVAAMNRNLNKLTQYLAQDIRQHGRS